MNEAIDDNDAKDKKDESSKKKKEDRIEIKEEDIVEERIYTIPLGRAWLAPRKKRAPRAIRLIKSFIKRHMKTDSFSLNNEVNEKIWRRGIEKPPRRISVRAIKNREGDVFLYLAEGD
jgi:large subunit ribosomal protein L31e